MPYILRINIWFYECIFILYFVPSRLFRQRFCKKYPEECIGQNTTWEEFCVAYKRLCPEFKPENFNFGVRIISSIYYF